MNDKEAIEELRNSYELHQCEWSKRCLDTIKAEIEKKDKIIELMIKVMIDSGICDYFIKQNCKHYAGENKKLCDVCIKEYFEKKAEKDNKNYD